MKDIIKNILGNAFYQLVVIYTMLVLLISTNLFWKYSLQMSIFALIIAILGISIIRDQRHQILDSLEDHKEPSRIDKLFGSKYLHYLIFALAIIFIILFRIIPYFNNSIPLGYDTGIYKYIIEHGLNNLDNWILQGGSEPGFLYLMKPFSIIFSSQFILTYLLIGFCILLSLAIYFTTKEFFDSKTAIIALLIYSVSIIQLKTFAYMYYKNIIALSFALFSIYFLKKYENKNNKLYLILFIILGGLTGAIHRPTFYIFGLSYFIYAFISPFAFNKSTLSSDLKHRSDSRYQYKLLILNILYGILILIIAGIFYIGAFRQAILVMIEPVIEGFVQTGESPGTFINFFTYQFSTLVYLPFAILGFFYLARKKQFNMLFLWALITAIIVYFQFFFFNRFIIHLDIMLIILASLGFSVLIENKKKLGVIILIVMLFSAGFVALNKARDSKPLITNQELQTIKYLQNTEENAFAMATSSIYSPWVLGYSNRKTIAPGLFDYSIHNKDEWMNFWTNQDINEIKTFMNTYNKPLYIFIGQKQKDNLANFSQCFELYYQNNNNIIYKYTC